MPDREREWLAGARRLDETTLAAIYDGLSPELYRYAFRLLGDRQNAEDVVSESFHRFLRAMQSGGGPRHHLRAYLYRVAHNLAIDRYRRRAAREPHLSLEDTTLAAEDNPALGAETALSQAEARDALWRLTPDQRQVIVLKYFEGLTNAEIAAAIEKPIGAVKSLQHRALEALRRVLSSDGSAQEAGK